MQRAIDGCDSSKAITPWGEPKQKKIKKKGGDRGATQDLLSRVELHVGIVIPKLC